MASIPSYRSPVSAEPMLVPQGDYAGKPALRLQKSVVVVGSAERCHLHLISSSVSRHHALIIHDQDGVYIRDLGSRTKVVVNGQPHRETLLANEDEIHIGKFSFRFAYVSPAGNATAPNPPMTFVVTGRSEPLVTHCRTVLIGKDDGCDISLPEDSASHRHAIIFTARGKRYIRDMESRTGTFVDGEKIHQREIHAGSELRIGETIITVGEIAQAETLIETPRPEMRAVPLETEHPPAADAKEYSEDSLRFPLEPAQVEVPPASAERPATPQNLPEPLKVEPAAETKADAFELALAADGIDLGKDSIPVEVEPPETPAASAQILEPLELEPASETKTEDSVPVDVEPEQTPSVTRTLAPEAADVPEFLKLDLEPEPNTDALESALADVEIDRKKDAAPVEPESPPAPVAIEKPAEPPANVSEPIKLELEPETSTSALESALADAEIDLNKGSPPVETEPEKRSAEPASRADESSHPEFHLPELSIGLEWEPAAQPEPVAREEFARAETAIVDLSVTEPATLMPPPVPQPPPLTTATIAEEAPVTETPAEVTEALPQPEPAVVEISNSPESPIDLDLNIDLDVKFETMSPPQVQPFEPFEPKVELTPMEPASDDPLNPPQVPPKEDAAQESSPDDAGVDESAGDAASASEELSEKSRKRPARGRKAASAPAKPAKPVRGKPKRLPPQSAGVGEPEPQSSDAEIPAESDEMDVEETPENWPGDTGAIPEIAEEIPGTFVPDEPAGIAPAISVQPQAPETPAYSDDISKDVWHMPPEADDEGVSAAPIPDEYSAEANLLSGQMEILETPLEVYEPLIDEDEAPFEAVEAALDDDDPFAGEWKIPVSATEEISPPIISDDQTGSKPSIAVEQQIPEAPLAGDAISTGEWAIPPAPSMDISAPTVADEPAPLVPPSTSSAPPPKARQPSPSQFLGALESLGGFSFVGGGEVNLDHSLGGMPVTLPELPPTPPGFGKVRIDLGGKPAQSRTPAPVSTPVSAPPAPPMAAPPKAPAPAPEPSPVVPAPAPPASLREAFSDGPPLGSRVNADNRRPPVSFSLDVSNGLPFATEMDHPIAKDMPSLPMPTILPTPPMAFDGLAMGAAHEADAVTDTGAKPTESKDPNVAGPAISALDNAADPEQNGAAPAPMPAAQRPQTPPFPATPEPAAIPEDDSNISPEDPGDTQSGAAMLSPEAPPAGKKRRFRIPFFMPMILVGVGVGVGIAAIWRFIPVQSQISGTMTFLNFSYIPGTQDSIDFEAAQRRLLDDQTRQHASEILVRDYPGIGQGFLKSPESFDKVAASVSLNSAPNSVSPQTLLQLSCAGSDKDADRLRMLSLLQSLVDRNQSGLDVNRQVREKLQRAQQKVDDAQQKVDRIKSQVADLTRILEAAPSAARLEDLTRKKNAMEQLRLNAEATVNGDRADLVQLAAARFDGPATQPAIADSDLKQMRQQLADLSAEMDSARSDQLAGAALARQKLQMASRQFDEQIAAANTLLGGGSQLRLFVDSAMESQTKARDLINMLIVDGEDLEQQLEDTRRDVDDLIQTQQDEKWALDPQLQSLRENLDSAQHRYNANAGQGVTDPRILDPLQKEIDDWTAQVKVRQAQLGADPGEMRVQESLNSIIDALRKKLAKEKHQTDQVLDPLEKQLADLDPVVAALPAAQQDLARQIHQRLDDLNNARQNFAETFGDEQIAPSAKITELKNRIADLKANIVARQADLEREAALSREQQQQGDIATLQARLQTDQKKFEDSSIALEAGLSAYDEIHAKQVAADGAQQRKMGLLDDQRSAFAELEAARRDRDEKQSAADHAFDIKPVAATDVIATTPPDPRMMYSLAVMAGGLIAVTLMAIFSHSGYRHFGKKSATPAITAELDSLVIPLASDDDHAATA